MKDIVRYCILMPIFLVGFCLVYNPFGIKEYLSGTDMGYFFHIIMFGCICMLVTAAMRAAILPISARYSFNAWHHLFWSFGEMFADAAFFALYVSLFKKIEYSDALAICSRYSFLCLIFPYTAMAMSYKGKTGQEDTSLMKFRDEHKNLKLSIKPESLLYIAAFTNYIKICYLEAGKTREFLVRTSMKSQDENIRAYSLVRCHRSYIVNPRHVAALRKEKDGPICAVLDSATEMTVPVSKQYYDSLSALL